MIYSFNQTNCNRKKILFVHHAKGWGGAPINMINIINKIDMKKYDVKVLLLKDSIVANMLREQGIPYSIAQSKFYRKYYKYILHSEAGFVKCYQIIRLVKLFIYWILSRYYFAKKEIAIERPDIIHLNSSALTDWLYPAKQQGKVIIHIQEPIKNGRMDLLYKFFRQQMKLYADKIIVISHDNAGRINIPEKTIVIYNYAKVPEESSPESSYSSKKFLYLGGSAYIKGFYTLISALDFLDDEIKILFAGDYSQSSIGKPLITIAKKFFGVGRKQRLALRKMKNHKSAVEIGLIFSTGSYFRDCCCLLSPFTVSHFSRPVIEAFLYKKPSIASDVEGMDEIVTHKVNGLLFKKNDIHALADSINYMAKNPDKAKQMGEHGYEEAIQKFTDTNNDDFESIYGML